MTFESPSSAIKMSLSDALHNRLIYGKHEKAQNQGKELHFGVYRGKRFVLIREGDSLFTRLHYHLCRLFRLIKTDPEAIEQLNQSSQARFDQWKPIVAYNRICASVEHLKATTQQLITSTKKEASEELEALKQKAQEQLETLKQKAQEQLEALKMKAQVRKKRIEELEGQLETKIVEKENELRTRFEQDVASIKHKKQTLKNELAELKAKLKEHQDNHVSLTKHLSRSEKYKTKIAALEAQIEELTKQNQALGETWDQIESQTQFLEKINALSTALISQKHESSVHKLLGTLTQPYRKQIEQYWDEHTEEEKHSHSLLKHHSSRRHSKKQKESVEETSGDMTEKSHHRHHSSKNLSKELESNEPEATAVIEVDEQ